MTKINPAQEIRNPSLTLYAFHLRNDITKGPQEVEANAAHLWETFEQLAKPLHTPELELLHNKLICYQNGMYDPAAEDEQLGDSLVSLLRSGTDNYFSNTLQSGGLELKVMVDPYRINDTYAADLTLFYEDSLPIAKLKYFNPQGCLLPSDVQASLGQTLVLFAEPVRKVDDYQALADECVASLLEKATLPKLSAKGYLFGSPIFEYDNREEDPAAKCHIWVWFNCDSQTPDKAQEATGTVLNLLCCYHKILYIYHQSRHCNQQARLLYAQLEQYIKKLAQLSLKTVQRLKQLQEWLAVLPQIEFDYARHWRDMEDHRTALAANINNYHQLLENLPQATEDDREFFQKFLTRAETKFQRQIQVDINFLAPGRELFSQLLGYIQGIVQAEQAERDDELQQLLRENELAEKERDRKLETTIAVVGVGLGVTEIVAGSTPYLIPQNSQQPIQPPLQSPFTSFKPHPFTQSLFLSLIFGIAAAALTGMLLTGWQYYSDKKAKRERH